MKINPKFIGALVGAVVLGIAVWIGISLTGSVPLSTPLAEPLRFDLGPLKDRRFESLVMPRNYDLAGIRNRLGRTNPFAALATSTPEKAAPPAVEIPNSNLPYQTSASSSPAL